MCQTNSHTRTTGQNNADALLRTRPEQASISPSSSFPKCPFVRRRLFRSCNSFPHTSSSTVGIILYHTNEPMNKRRPHARTLSNSRISNPASTLLPSFFPSFLLCLGENITTSINKHTVHTFLLDTSQVRYCTTTRVGEKQSHVTQLCFSINSRMAVVVEVVY